MKIKKLKWINSDLSFTGKIGHRIVYTTGAPSEEGEYCPYSLLEREYIGTYKNAVSAQNACQKHMEKYIKAFIVKE